MSANDEQIGGEHYRQESLRGNPQHWDLVCMYQWDYFQAAVTKYLMRWKTKYKGNPEKQLEDLKKSRQYLDKYIEEYERFLEPNRIAVAPVTPVPPASPPKPGLTLTEYEAGYPQYMQDAHYRNEGGYGSGENLYTCLLCNNKVTALSLEKAHEQHDGVCTGEKRKSAPS